MVIVSGSPWDRHHLSLRSGMALHFATGADAEVNLCSVADEIGMTSYVVQAGAVTSKPQLMSAMASVLNAPPGFGANWDALRDTLLEMSSTASSGYVIIVRDADGFARAAPHDFRLFVAVATDVTRDARESEVPFHFVFIGSADLKTALAAATTIPICTH